MGAFLYEALTAWASCGTMGYQMEGRMSQHYKDTRNNLEKKYGRLTDQLNAEMLEAEFVRLRIERTMARISSVRRSITALDREAILMGVSFDE